MEMGENWKLRNTVKMLKVCEIFNFRNLVSIIKYSLAYVDRNDVFAEFIFGREMYSHLRRLTDPKSLC